MVGIQPSLVQLLLRHIPTYILESLAVVQEPNPFDHREFHGVKQCSTSIILAFAFKGTTKIILLVTDGRTKDDIQAITEQMKTNDDVIIIAVGLYRAPLAELSQIATSDDLVFYTKDFHRIWNFFTQLTKKMCSLRPKGNDLTI